MCSTGASQMVTEGDIQRENNRTEKVLHANYTTHTSTACAGIECNQNLVCNRGPYSGLHGTVSERVRVADRLECNVAKEAG